MSSWKGNEGYLWMVGSSISNWGNWLWLIGKVPLYSMWNPATKPINCTVSKLQGLIFKHYHRKQIKGAPYFWLGTGNCITTHESHSSLVVFFYNLFFSGGWQNHKVITKQLSIHQINHSVLIFFWPFSF